MTLSSSEKAARARQRMVDKAREYSLGTYCARFVAPLYQKMVRAEYAAQPSGITLAVVCGELGYVFRDIGQCVCVTCGKVAPWSGGLRGMHTGHFLASRRNSILFEPDNAAPQCSRCNRYESGAPERFRLWMLREKGPHVIEWLEQLKRQTRHYSREELVDMRIEFGARLKAAEKRIRQGLLDTGLGFC